MKFQGKLLLSNLAPQELSLNGTTQGSNKVVTINRLEDIVIRSTSEGLDGKTMLAVAGD